MHLRLHWPLIRNNFTCTGNTSQILALLTFLLASERRHNFVQNNAFSSVQFSRSVVSDSLRPHGLQHARPPCPSPTPRVHPNPCPSSRWCHPTISSSVVPFSSCPQSFPASGSVQTTQLFVSGGQSIQSSINTSQGPIHNKQRLRCFCLNFSALGLSFFLLI